MDDIGGLIYVIVIIIGIVFSIIKKISESKSQQKAPQRPLPKQQPVQQALDSSQAEAPPKERTPLEDFFKLFEDDPYQPAAATMKAPPPAKTEPQEYVPPPAAPEPIKPTPKPEVTLQPKQPERLWLRPGQDKQTLRDLILVAEVLGPCKAKHRKATI